MFSATVPVMSVASCGTNATLEVHDDLSISVRSIPFAVIDPLAGVRIPRSYWTRVDLPLPEGPTTPIASPCLITKLIRFSTGVLGR